MAEALFSAEQIRIPPELPEILKNYAKFIIKSQPPDILASSAEYFARLAKQRTQANGGKRLTDMQLEAFYTQFSASGDRAVTRKDIDDAASAANIPATQVQDILSLGGWAADRVPWLKFWAFLCASAAGTLLATIELVCEVAGDNNKISLAFVQDVFTFLAEQDRSINPSTAANVVRVLESLNPREYSIPALIEIIAAELEGKSSSSGAAHSASAPSQTMTASEHEGAGSGEGYSEHQQTTESEMVQSEEAVEEAVQEDAYEEAEEHQA